MTVKSTITSILLAGVLAPAVLAAQPRPPSPVRYTEAREHDVRRSLRLPGSVQAKTSSLVASEVEGLVARIRAHEGQTVRKGQLLAELKTAQLELEREAAAAQLREARARLKQAEKNLERSQELFDSEVLSRGQLDDASYELEAWKGRSEQLAADIARIQLDIERSAVRAPFAGVVVAEQVDIGEWVGKGQAVMELVSMYELEVLVEVPERHFRELNPGGTATVSFESLPGFEVTGKLTSIIPRASLQARTFPIKVRILNRQGRIGVGMLAQVALPVGTSYRATVIPKDALITRGQRRFVYLLNGDSTVEMVPVETGAGVGGWIEVHRGVEPGSKVITRGNERLRPGQKVEGQPMEYAHP